MVNKMETLMSVTKNQIEDTVAFDFNTVLDSDYETDYNHRRS